jgi:hypothetical protein
MESESSTTNLVNTLKNTIPTPDIINSTEDTTTYFFPKMILIIILFAFIGGGVFIYLAKGDKSFREFVTPYLNKLGIDIGTDKEDDDTTTYDTTTTTMYDRDTTTYDRDTTTTSSTYNYGRTGATGPARPTPMDTTIDTTTTIDTRTTTTPIYKTTTTRKTETKDDGDDAAVECDNPKKEKLMKALNNAAQTADYMADDASSSIQCVNKSKWCFIGEEKGVRNCVLLNDDQKCMSGDIFPSRDICINPKMRT